MTNFGFIKVDDEIADPVKIALKEVGLTVQDYEPKNRKKKFKKYTNGHINLSEGQMT